MQVPITTFALVAVVIFFVPGFVFAVIRIWQRGFRADDKGLDGRIAQALVVSVIFDSLYLVCAYWWLPAELTISASQIVVLAPVALGTTVLAGAAPSSHCMDYLHTSARPLAERSSLGSETEFGPGPNCG